MSDPLELLEPKVKAAKRKFKDIKRGLVYSPKKPIYGEEQLNAWYRKKLDDLQAIAPLLTGAIEELNAAWGKPGTPGDELEIKRAVDIIDQGFDGLLEWELDLHATVFPAKFKVLTELMHGWAGNLISQMEYYPNKLVELFIDNPPPTEGRFVIGTEIESPRNLDEVTNFIMGRQKKAISQSNSVRGCLKFIILAFLCLPLFWIPLLFFVSGLGFYGIPLSIIAGTLAFYSPNYRNWLYTQPGYTRRLSNLPGLQSSSPTVLTISTLSYLLPISLFSTLLISSTISKIDTALTTAVLGLIGIVILYGWSIKGWFLSSPHITATKFPFRAIVSDITSNHLAVSLIAFSSFLPVLCCGGVFTFALVNEPLREAGLLPTHTPTSLPIYTRTSTPTLTSTPMPTDTPKPTDTPEPTLTDTPVVSPTATPTFVIPYTDTLTSTVSITATSLPTKSLSLPSGETLMVDNWEIRVERVEITEQMTFQEKLRKSTGRFVLVFMTITNHGLSPDTFVTFGTVEIKDSEGRTYDEDSVVSFWAEVEYKTDLGADINPDDTAFVVAVYDIPKRNDNYSLVPGRLAHQGTGNILLNIP